MAYEWDDEQIRWLRTRPLGKRERFQEKIVVGGSSLEIDAVAQNPEPDEFFDFLTRISVFENKAPSEVFDVDDLRLSSARTLLLHREWRLELSALADTTQVVLCSRVSRRLRRALGGHELRPGVLVTHFVTRVVIVEANRLDVTTETLPVLIRYATRERVRPAIVMIVENELKEHYPVLWFLRRELFREVLAMKGKTTEPETIDLAGAVEDFGIKRVVDSVGLEKVIEAVGLEQVIEAVGPEKVIDAIGLEKAAEVIQTARGVQKRRGARPRGAKTPSRSRRS